MQKVVVVSLANTKNQGGGAIGCLRPTIPTIGCSVRVALLFPCTPVIFPGTLQFGVAPLL